VESWHRSEIMNGMRNLVARNEGTFVEQYMHNLAREIHKNSCDANREYEKVHPRPSDTDGYGIWDIMAEKRTTPKSDVLWHDADEPIHYCRAARIYGLHYHVEDFVDANQGEGRGEP
jgi:nitrous oxide reductase accessory protein NosL